MRLIEGDRLERSNMACSRPVFTPARLAQRCLVGSGPSLVGMFFLAHNGEYVYGSPYFRL